MNERKLTFSVRQALAIVGSLETRLYKASEKAEVDPKALRTEDRLIMDAVNDRRTAREVVARSGLDFETGLHSVAWLILTGFLYSATTVERLVEEQADRLALFAELFNDAAHRAEFWQTQIERLMTDDPELAELAPGLLWKGLTPQLKDRVPSPAQVREYFLRLFVALYDKAEEIFGAQSVLAKRILLDVRLRL